MAQVATPSYNFTKIDGVEQFYVAIPPQVLENTEVDKRLKKGCGANWNTTFKAYVFGTRKITKVEQILGVPPGSSGIRNPDNYRKVQITANIPMKGSLPEDKKVMADLNIDYKAGAFRMTKEQFDNLPAELRNTIV